MPAGKRWIPLDFCAKMVAGGKIKYMETTLAKSIRVTNEKAAYDAACKRLLSEKMILAWIMKECVQEYAGMDVREIVKYIEGAPQTAEIPVAPDEAAIQRVSGRSTEDISLNEGTVTYDIRFFAAVPGTGEALRLIINVEAQNNFYPGYPIIKRGIYYCSRMISSQYGSEFTGSHYEKIKKVYSIWICMNPPKYRENTITGYSLKEKNIVGCIREKTENYDLLTVVMLCLGDYEKAEAQGILKLLGVLLSAETSAKEKKKILEHDFKIPVDAALESEVERMCNLSDGVEEMGIKKGIQKGIEQNTIASIKSLIETLKLTAEEAMNALKVPDSDREKYFSMLKQQ